jgi:hypothetical protein
MIAHGLGSHVSKEGKKQNSTILGWSELWDESVRHKGPNAEISAHDYFVAQRSAATNCGLIKS